MTQEPTAPTTHLNAGQLAHRWGVSPGHLSNLRTKGCGPAYLKLGTRVIYRVEDVEEYEASRIVRPVVGETA